jgi:hypothetical protein
MALLLLAALACEQAGEIVTSEEATRRAEEARQFVPVESVDTTGPQIGETVTLIGRGFLVNLLDAPDGKIVAGQERGAEVLIEDIAATEGELWYRIKGSTGSGWVSEANIEPIEQEEEAAAEGPQVGDTVYLTGRLFLVNLYNQPGGIIAAGQERGVTVTIVQIADHEGERWYLIDAPTGEWWAPAENITTEAP